MKGILIIGSKLALICAVAGIALAIVNAFTEPAILEYKKKAQEKALLAVIDKGNIGDEIKVKDNHFIKGYYPVSNNSGELTAYICNLIGDGYSGDMKILASFTNGGEVINVILMENQETPGLGKEAEYPEYMDKYRGFGGKEKPIPVRKSQLSQENADAVTGASITFIGIAKALEKGSLFTAKMGGEK